MKKILNWQDKEIVNIYDEVNLWNAPFGRLLLENLPMQKGAVIVDLGFGTGFPLIELSQRFDESSLIYGVDIWNAAIERTKEKIKILELNNIVLLEESAAKVNIGDQKIDLITSNLGVNNFEEKDKIYAEIYRILKKDGKLCITTNPIGTFKELFLLFEEVIDEMGAKEEKEWLNDYISNRKTEKQIIEEFKSFNLKLVKKKSDYTNLRFLSSESLLNHSIIRIGFREGWNKIITASKREQFYSNLSTKIEAIIEANGIFEMNIPMLYLEFVK